MFVSATASYDELLLASAVTDWDIISELLTAEDPVKWWSEASGRETARRSCFDDANPFTAREGIRVLEFSAWLLNVSCALCIDFVVQRTCPMVYDLA
jgi:hypothetical protein